MKALPSGRQADPSETVLHLQRLQANARRTVNRIAEDILRGLPLYDLAVRTIEAIEAARQTSISRLSGLTAIAAAPSAT